MTATPIGVVPTLSGALDSAAWRDSRRRCRSEPEFVTMATSRSVSMATPTGEVPTATG